MMPAQEALLRASFKVRREGDFHTMAGFDLFAMGHLPALGERFDYEGWQFEIIDLDGRRIDKFLAIPIGSST